MLGVLLCARIPVVLVPGSFQTSLTITSTRKSAWYCPEVSRVRGWLPFGMAIPPFLSCWLDWMTVSIEESTSTLRNLENVTISPIDFEGVDGIRANGPVLFGVAIQPYFQNIINKLESKGYAVHDDLFGAPYDWRFGAAIPDSYFGLLQGVIEKAVEKNGMKAAVISHSLGCQLLTRLLTEKTTEEWREKFIDRIVMVAPSWSGSGKAFRAMWLANLFPNVFGRIRTFMKSLGTLHVHVPHALGYGNETMFVDVDGKGYKGVDAFPVIKERMLDAQSSVIAEENMKFARVWPVAPNVNTTILYNSGVQTALGLDLSKGFLGTTIYAKGDGLVGTAVIEWACKNWNMTKELRCIDVDSPNSGHRHKGMLLSEDTSNMIIQLATGEQIGSRDEL